MTEVDELRARLVSRELVNEARHHVFRIVGAGKREVLVTLRATQLEHSRVIAIA